MTDETKRDRVRRLLLQPLGFRKRGDVSADRQKEILDRVCDDLAYLSDQGLARVREAVQFKGAGSDRNAWPDLATFRAFAELAEPRPIEELPALLRWFGSVEGPKAIEEGTLVETHSWFARHKRPPAKPNERQFVREKAAENARRLELVDDLRRRGRQVDAGEADWVRAYNDRRAYLERLVAEQRAAKEAAE